MDMARVIGATASTAQGDSIIADVLGMKGQLVRRDRCHVAGKFVLPRGPVGTLHPARWETCNAASRAAIGGAAEVAAKE
jgi:hypothetical protein